MAGGPGGGRDPRPPARLLQPLSSPSAPACTSRPHCMHPHIHSTNCVRSARGLQACTRCAWSPGGAPTCLTSPNTNPQLHWQLSARSRLMTAAIPWLLACGTGALMPQHGWRRKLLPARRVYITSCVRMRTPGSHMHCCCACRPASSMAQAQIGYERCNMSLDQVLLIVCGVWAGLGCFAASLDSWGWFDRFMLADAPL